MPIPHIDDYREKKEKSYASWYLLAGISGVALFYFFVGFTKVSIFVIKIVIDHWVWFGIGVLVLLILIRILKKKKRKREIRRDEHSY